MFSVSVQELIASASRGKNCSRNKLAPFKHDEEEEEACGGRGNSLGGGTVYVLMTC